MSRHYYTYEEVKQAFSSEGYVLLTTKYKNSHEKLDFICPKGHKHSMTWHAFKAGSRCYYCSHIVPYTLEYIDKELTKEGYTLLSTEYVNVWQHIEFICPQGHEYSMSFKAWLKGQRCGLCNRNFKLNIEFVRESLDKEGYTLLSTKYVNSTTDFSYRCPEGHEHVTKWQRWYVGNRCPTCNLPPPPTFNEIKESFENEGYTLLTTEYINSSTKMDYICPLGHKRSITWASWYHSKCRCRICKYIDLSGPGSPTWRGGISFEPYCETWTVEFKDFIKARDGYKCLNPYCSSENPEDLNVHHIDYDKKNCNQKNLITVCRSCNARANHDREWHTAWYQVILQKRYNYQY